MYHLKTYILHTSCIYPSNMLAYILPTRVYLITHTTFIQQLTIDVSYHILTIIELTIHTICTTVVTKQ